MSLYYAALSSCALVPSLGPSSNPLSSGEKPNLAPDSAKDLMFAPVDSRAEDAEDFTPPGQQFPAKAQARQPAAQHTGTINKADLTGLQDGEETEEKSGVTGLGEALAHSRLSGEWRLPELHTLKAVSGHKAGVLGIFRPLQTDAAAPERSISVDASGQVLVWDILQGRAYELMQAGKLIERVAFFPDTLWLALAYGATVELYSLSKPVLLMRLDRLQSRVTALDFQPKGESLLIGAADGRVYRWKFGRAQGLSLKEQDKLLERYIGHGAVISSVVFHPWGRLFFSADWRGSLWGWLTYDSDIFRGEYDENLFHGRPFAEEAVRSRVPRGDSQAVAKLQVSPDGQWLFVGLQDGRLEWWLVRGLRKLAEVQAHKGLIYDLQVAPGLAKLATSGRDGKVRVWALTPPGGKTKAAVAERQEVTLAEIGSMAFLDDRRLLAGAADGRLLEIKVE